MVSLDEAVTARLESHGTRFEVLVDPDKAQKVSGNPEENRLESNDLAADKVFKDANKGKEAADENLEDVFGTTDVVEAANKIVAEGDIQLTTQQRREMKENKRKAIVSYLSRHAMNPQTGNPHPPQRIENAMENVKFHVDPFESTQAQVDELLEKLRPIIPIRVEQVQVHVRIPAEHTGAAYGVVRETGNLIREEWKSDGAWVGVVEIPAGMQTDFYEKLNERTKGNVQTKLER